MTSVIRFYTSHQCIKLTQLICKMQTLLLNYYQPKTYSFINVDLSKYPGSSNKHCTDFSVKPNDWISWDIFQIYSQPEWREMLNRQSDTALPCDKT